MVASLAALCDYRHPRGAQLQYRIWAQKDGLYELMMEAPAKSYLTDNEKAFFDSFRTR